MPDPFEQVVKKLRAARFDQLSGRIPISEFFARFEAILDEATGLLKLVEERPEDAERLCGCGLPLLITGKYCTGGHQQTVEKTGHQPEGEPSEVTEPQPLKCDGCGRSALPGEDGLWQRLDRPIVGNAVCPECQKIDAEPTEEEAQAAALDQALAERDRLAEVAEELAEALRDVPYKERLSSSDSASAHYRALKEEAK